MAIIQKKFNPNFAGKAAQASSRADRMREQADGTETLLRNLDNQIAETFDKKDRNAAALARLRNEAEDN